MQIDARGLSCPEPVIRTKACLETHHPGSITVLVDNPASQENVHRFLESQGYTAALSRTGEDYVITGGRDGVPEQSAHPLDEPPETREKILVFCSTDRIGTGDDDLGKKLMASFIKTLDEMGTDLWKLVFVNNGVKLCVEGAAVLPDLQALEKNGVSVMVCGTCLTHFNLLEKKQVGETTNMLDIVTAMHLAGKVITM